MSEEREATMSDAEIDRLVAAFESHELPLEDWHHAAHLTVATAYTIADEQEATDRIRTAIQGFNISKGVPQTDTGGYHESVTVFFMHMVRHVLRGLDASLSRPDKVKAVIAALGDRKVMLDYYTRDAAMSKQARYGWVEPDVRPLP